MPEPPKKSPTSIAFASSWCLPPGNASLPPIHALARTRLMHRDLRQFRHLRLQPLPYPPRNMLARRILQPRHLVQKPMVQLLLQRPKLRLQIPKIHQPPRPRVHRPAHHHLHPKRMPVQPRTLMPRRHLRQTMRRLKVKFLGQLNDKWLAHRRIVPQFSPGPWARYGAGSPNMPLNCSPFLSITLESQPVAQTSTPNPYPLPGNSAHCFHIRHHPAIAA